MAKKQSQFYFTPTLIEQAVSFFREMENAKHHGDERDVKIHSHSIRLNSEKDFMFDTYGTCTSEWGSWEHSNISSKGIVNDPEEFSFSHIMELNTIELEELDDIFFEMGEYSQEKKLEIDFIIYNSKNKSFHFELQNETNSYREAWEYRL